MVEKGSPNLGSIRSGKMCDPSLCNFRGTCELVSGNKLNNNGTTVGHDFKCHCSTGWSGQKCESGKLPMEEITILKNDE